MLPKELTVVHCKAHTGRKQFVSLENEAADVALKNAAFSEAALDVLLMMSN